MPSVTIDVPGQALPHLAADTMVVSGIAQQVTPFTCCLLSSDRSLPVWRSHLAADAVVVGVLPQQAQEDDAEGVADGAHHRP